MADLDGYDPCWSDPDPEYWSSEMTLTVKKKSAAGLESQLPIDEHSRTRSFAFKNKSRKT
jgi:hypothetical protein